MNRLPQTAPLNSLKHSNLSPDTTTTTSIYIPDSTNYKSTASGANNEDYDDNDLQMWFDKGEGLTTVLVGTQLFKLFAAQEGRLSVRYDEY